MLHLFGIISALSPWSEPVQTQGVFCAGSIAKSGCMRWDITTNLLKRDDPYSPLLNINYQFERRFAPAPAVCTQQTLHNPDFSTGPVLLMVKCTSAQWLTFMKLLKTEAAGQLQRVKVHGQGALWRLKGASGMNKGRVWGGILSIIV